MSDELGFKLKDNVVATAAEEIERGRRALVAQFLGVLRVSAPAFDVVAVLRSAEPPALAVVQAAEAWRGQGEAFVRAIESLALMGAGIAAAVAAAQTLGASAFGPYAGDGNAAGRAYHATLDDVSEVPGEM